MDKLKLKWRVFSFMLIFCGLLLSILWLFQTVFLNDMYKLIRTNEINNAIKLVEENINSSNIQNIFRELQIEKEIIVMSTNEFMIYKPIENPTQAEKLIESRDIYSAPPENRLQSDSIMSRATHGKATEALTKTKIFTLNNGLEVSLTFYALITPVDATVSTLKMQLYIITAIMILLSVILAIIISKHISKPIEDINNNAKSLSTGNYDVNFSTSGFLEVVQLAETLNTAAKELSAVEGLRKELLANVSHDLRTPLALIYSYAEMMHDFPQDVNEENLQVIMDESKRLTSLVNDVMDISKYEQGNWKLNLKEFNLTACIQDTIYRMSEMLKDKGYNIKFEYDEEIIVNADEIKIGQVLYNLLINAVNYSTADNPIIVKQQINNDKVTIRVIDRGKGIDQELLPYIWDRYYRSKDNHTRAITGSGLGLSIVKKIIDSHNGECGVKSIIDVGSEFWFTLKI